MNVSSLSLDDNSMDVVMEKGTLDSLQEKSRDTTVRLCYFASPCNKSDSDQVAYVNHMIPLAFFYRDMLGACLCIRSAYPLKKHKYLSSPLVMANIAFAG